MQSLESLHCLSITMNILSDKKRKVWKVFSFAPWGRALKFSTQKFPDANHNRWFQGQNFQSLNTNQKQTISSSHAIWRRLKKEKKLWIFFPQLTASSIVVERHSGDYVHKKVELCRRDAHSFCTSARRATSPQHFPYAKTVRRLQKQYLIFASWSLGPSNENTATDSYKNKAGNAPGQLSRVSKTAAIAAVLRCIPTSSRSKKVLCSQIRHRISKLASAPPSA